MPDQTARAFFAPGRVNLIGDHTDYCGGLVFPCATDLGTTLLIRRRNDNKINLASQNFDYTAVLTPQQAQLKQADEWVNYPLGVVRQFVEAGFSIEGIDCLYSGNLPNGAGLSSSASIELVTAFALNAVFACELDNVTLVKMAQRAENEFVGVQCGIMDQYAVAMAQSDHAMKLKCDTLDCEQVPLPLANHQLIITNSNQRRELSGSSYNQRVKETQQALQLLQTKFTATHLAQITSEQLLSQKSLFDKYSIEFRRAHHVISEHTRVEHAVQALTDNNLEEFGKLMAQSHQSLRDDYEVSSTALNALVDTALAQPGVLGSRLTGAGFGGCTISLVAQEQVANFIDNVGDAYYSQFDVKADFYPVQASRGVHELTL